MTSSSSSRTTFCYKYVSVLVSYEYEILSTELIDNWIMNTTVLLLLWVWLSRRKPASTSYLRSYASAASVLSPFELFNRGAFRFCWASPHPLLPKSWFSWCRATQNTKLHTTQHIIDLISPNSSQLICRGSFEVLIYLILMGSTAFLLSSLFATAVAASD